MNNEIAPASSLIRGSKHKCQMPGCGKKANQTAKIQGIFNGIYVDKCLNHCGYHRSSEISDRVDFICNKAVIDNGLLNPYKVAPFVSKHAS